MREMAGQQSLLCTPIDHNHARELVKMGQLLDEASEVVTLVQADLLRGVKNPKTGRPGMNAELVLRALIVKQMNGYSYDELAFHLADSASYQRFCRIGYCDTVPSAKTLQRNFKLVRPETLEAANRVLMQTAQRRGIEAGDKLRGDCTVTESNIHEPADSSLLDDCVRVLTRAMHRARELVHIGFTDHTKRARRRAIAILYAARKNGRVLPYKDLIKVTTLTVRAAQRATTKLDGYRGGGAREVLAAMALAAELRHYVPLAEKVINQTQRRVLGGESVPAADKVVSIFEPHTDIIRKDNRNTFYGHKLYLSSGVSGLITDCVVLDGNPADSTLAVDAVDRHREVFGRLPKQVAFDGGFASRSNLEAIKERGVADVAFAKGRGLDVTEMVTNSTVYRSLRNFRAGIEAGISFLKRAFGLGRCTWRSLASFKSYVWSSVVAANLLILARHLPD
jgi:transposase, IS5 family